MNIEYKPRIIDLHQDIGYYIMMGRLNKDFNLRDKNRHGDIPSYKEANVFLIVGAIFPMLYSYSPYIDRISRMYGGSGKTFYISPINPIDNILTQIGIYWRLSKLYDVINIVRSRETLRDDKINILIGIEGTDGIDDISVIYPLYLAGVRLVGLTWNFDTKYAASCVSTKDYGLTGYGLELIDELNRLGIIIDLAHSSEKTMLETIEESSLPVINSHSNYKRIVDHPRNVSYEVLDALRSKGGVIGFTLIKETIGGKMGLKDYVSHIIRVRDEVGKDVIAFGSDFFGTTPPKEFDRIDKIGELYRLLTENGFTKDDLERFTWRNAYRVIKRHMSKWD